MYICLERGKHAHKEESKSQFWSWLKQACNQTKGYKPCSEHCSLCQLRQDHASAKIDLKIALKACCEKA